jgi:hypothetical protein
VAQRMGHTDPALTLRVYGHLFEGVQEVLTDRLEERRKAAAPPAGDVVSLRPAIGSSGPGQDPKIRPFSAIGGHPRSPRKYRLTWEDAL